MKRGLGAIMIMVMLCTITMGCNDDDDGLVLDETSSTSIGWVVTVNSDNYLIEIVAVDPIAHDDIGFKLLDEYKLTAKQNDPNNTELRMEGGLEEVLYVQADYESADTIGWTNSTCNERFYCDDEPMASDYTPNNLTLYIIYLDVDANDKLSSGDMIWIRSTDWNGPAEEGFIFRLINQASYEPLGELTLPVI